MRVLDLFSGIGGFSLGLERAGMETVAFCEYDKKAQLVLKKHWPNIPIFEDVKKLNGHQLTDLYPIELICGGFPCQPFSSAGKRLGKADNRALWPEYFRLIQEIRPRWIIGENVAGLINMGLDQVLSDLESANYSCQAVVIPACAINAPHRRDRVWICAYTSHSNCGVLPGTSPETERGFQEGVEQFRSGGEAGNLRSNETILANPGLLGQAQHEKQATGIEQCGETMADTENARALRGKWLKGNDARKSETWGSDRKGSHANYGGEDVANPKSHGTQGSGSTGKQKPQAHVEQEIFRRNSSGSGTNHGSIEPGMGGLVDGLSRKLECHWRTEPTHISRTIQRLPGQKYFGRMDRLKQFGNAVIPQIVEIIGREIMQIENAKNS